MKEIQTEPGWIRSVAETPWLDESATADEDGLVGIVVINVHEEKSWSTDIQGSKKVREVQVFTVTGSDVEVKNGDGMENVQAKESHWDGQGQYTFGKHLLTLLRWKIEENRRRIGIGNC